MDDFTWKVIAQQKAWLDAATDLTGDQLLMLHLLKISEEHGEAADALISHMGLNLRKSQTTMDDVVDELCDVTITSLLALATATDDPREALAARLAHIYTRSLDHGAPALPKAEFNPDRQAWLDSLPTVLAATVVLFTDEHGRVLLVQQGYRPGPRNWALPGGGLDDGEPPRIGALREVTEEIAQAVRPGRVLTSTWHPPTDRPPLIVAVFDGGTLTPQQAARIRLLDGELEQFRFVTLAEAEPLMSQVAHRELATALVARAYTDPMTFTDGRSSRTAPEQTAATDGAP